MQSGENSNSFNSVLGSNYILVTFIQITVQCRQTSKKRKIRRIQMKLFYLHPVHLYNIQGVTYFARERERKCQSFLTRE